MKKILLMMTFVVCASHSVWADPACPVIEQSLAIYLGTTFTCGDLTFTFSSGAYTSSGSTPIPAADVFVTSETVGSETGLEFNAPWGQPSGAGDPSTDSFITFTAACNSGCDISDLTLNLGGASASPDGGLVLVSETAPPDISLQAGSGGGTTILSDSTLIAPTSSITVSKDILVIGGTGGIGSQVSNVQNLFSTNTSTVPEPSLLFLCTGLLALVPVARRRFGI
jgi:hypothetical protein